MTKTATIAATLAGAALLAGCSGNEADKATARATALLPGALEAVGLHGLSWESARVDGNRITLLRAKGDLDGSGPVTTDEIVVTGFRQDGNGWSADSIQADRMGGALMADKAVLTAPRATPAGKSWTLAYENRVLDGFSGRLAGMALSGKHLDERSYETGTRGIRQEAYAARGLTVAVDPAMPPAARVVAGKPWDLTARLISGSTGRAEFEVMRAETVDWRIKGRISLALPRDAAPVPTGTSAFLPSSWPSGYALTAFQAELVLARPAVPLAQAGTPPGVLGALAEAGRRMDAVTWLVEGRPPTPIPLRDLPGVVESPASDTALDISARGDGIPAEFSIPPSVRLAGPNGRPPGPPGMPVASPPSPALPGR